MKIMIADDEVIIRTGMATVIRWHDLGLELLPPAASAEEVLERIAVERPDILLTDIQMNGKTGLQLAEEARATLPDLEVIILSGYDDFIYTQQAIRLNVSDYLLKTSRPEEIIRTVLKVKQRVEERRAAQSRDQARSREQRHGLLKRCVVDGEPFNNEVKDILDSLMGTGSESTPLTSISLIEAEGWGQMQSEQSLLLFAVDNMLADLLPCTSFVHKNTVIVGSPWYGSIADKRQQRTIIEKIERFLKCKLTVITGKPVTDPVHWHESYLTAMEARPYKPLLVQNHWDYADIEHRKGGKTVCTYEEEKELSVRLLENDPIGLKTWVQRYIGQLLEDPDATPKSFEAAIQSVSIAAHRWIDRVLASIGREAVKEDHLEPLQYNAQRVPNDHLFQHLYAIMKLYHHQYAEGKVAHVQKAIAYMEEQIGNDVGLAQVAEYVHLHPNHLSELFKKETGMKFVDFMTMKKMERAIELLSTSPAKVSEIAARVGYEDVKYFGQMFKKHTGKTPSEYRDHLSTSRGR